MHQKIHQFHSPSESSSRLSSYTCCLDLLPSSCRAPWESRVAVNRGYICNSDIAVPFEGLFKSFKWNEEVGKMWRFETEKRVRVNKALKLAHNIHLKVKSHNVRVQIFSWHWGKHRFNIHINGFQKFIRLLVSFIIKLSLVLCLWTGPHIEVPARVCSSCILSPPPRGPSFKPVVLSIWWGSNSLKNLAHSIHDVDMWEQWCCDSQDWRW